MNMKKKISKKNNPRNGKILINIDTIPNILKMPGQEKFAKDSLRQELEQDLDNRILRYKELPAIMVQMKSDKDEYVKLLHEARKLYIEGRFYSCITMCGVTSERIAKDILKRIILIKKLDGTNPSIFFKQLDRVPMDVVRELIISAGAVDSSLRDDFTKLAGLRDKYVHARSIESQNDARKAVKHLHNIVEGTVSVFKKYKIQQGKLVPK